jgi:putative FmdB family regulatory protein
MPTYEYACQKCGQQFEFFQSMKDQPLTTCPKEKCQQKRWGKGRVKKLMSSGAGLLFKGTGFYITDYRSENYKQSAKKESAAGETKSSSSESKTTPAKAESKPASSASAKKDK